MYTGYVYDATVQLKYVQIGYTQSYLLKNIESLCILDFFRHKTESYLYLYRL